MFQKMEDQPLVPFFLPVCFGLLEVKPRTSDHLMELYLNVLKFFFLHASGHQENYISWCPLILFHSLLLCLFC